MSEVGGVTGSVIVLPASSFKYCRPGLRRTAPCPCGGPTWTKLILDVCRCPGKKKRIIETRLCIPLSCRLGKSSVHVHGSEPPLPSSTAHYILRVSAHTLPHCCYQPIRLALAFSVSLRTLPLEEVPKVMDESSNSSCLCSSSESSSMYQAERRPWLRVRMDPPAPSPS